MHGSVKPDGQGLKHASFIGRIREITGRNKDSGVIRVEKDAQYQSQEQRWTRLFRRVAQDTTELEYDTTSQALQTLMQAEAEVIRDHEWGQHAFCGCIVRGSGPEGDDSRHYAAARPVLLSDRGRYVLGYDADTPRLATWKDLGRLKIHSTSAFTTATTAANEDEYFVVAMSPLERLNFGDCFRNLPVPMEDLIIALWDAYPRGRPLLLLAVMYVAQCSSVSQGGDWASCLTGDSATRTCPLSVVKPVKENWSPIANGLYTTLGCKSPFPDPETIKKEDNSWLPFITSKEGLKLTPAARTVLDFERVWLCVSGVIDMMAFEEVEDKYGFDGLSMRMEVARALWNHGSLGAKKLNKYITTALFYIRNLYVPLCYQGGTVLQHLDSSTPDITYDVRGLQVNSLPAEVSWELMSHEARDAFAPGMFEKQLEELRERGLNSWADALSKVVANTGFCDVITLFNEPLQYIGYANSDPSYALVATPHDRDLPTSPDRAEHEAEFRSMCRVMIQEAISQPAGLREAHGILADHMSTNRSAGGAKVRMVLPPSVARTLGYRPIGVAAKKDIRVTTTGKAVVSATIGKLLDKESEITRIGTKEVPFGCAFRSVPLRDTRIIFMVPTSTQLPLGPLYKGTGRAMRRGFTTDTGTKYDGDSFVPAKQAPSEFMKAAAIMLASSMSLSSLPFTQVTGDFKSQDRHSQLTMHWMIEELEAFPGCPIWTVLADDGTPVDVPWNVLAAKALKGAVDAWYIPKSGNGGRTGDPTYVAFHWGGKLVRLTLDPGDGGLATIRIFANPSGIWITERMNSMVSACVNRFLKYLMLVNGDDVIGLTDSPSIEECVARMMSAATALGQVLTREDTLIEFGSFLRITYAGLSMHRRHMPFDSESPTGRVPADGVKSYVDKAAKLFRRGGSMKNYLIFRDIVLALAGPVNRFGYVYTPPPNYYAWIGQYPGVVGDIPCTPNRYALADHESEWRSILDLAVGEPLTMKVIRLDNKDVTSLTRRLVGIEQGDVTGVKFEGHGLGRDTAVMLEGAQIPATMKVNLRRPLDPDLLRLSKLHMESVRARVPPQAFEKLSEVQYELRYARATEQVLRSSILDERVRDATITRLSTEFDDILVDDVFSLPDIRPYSIEFRVAGHCRLLDVTSTGVGTAITLFGRTEVRQIDRIGHYDVFPLERVFMSFFGYSSTRSGRYTNVFPTGRDDLNQADYMRLSAFCRNYHISPEEMVAILGLSDNAVGQMYALLESPAEVTALADILQDCSFVTSEAFTAIDGHMISEYGLLTSDYDLSPLERTIFESLLMSYTLTSWSMSRRIFQIYGLHISRTS